MRKKPIESPDWGALSREYQDLHPLALRFCDEMTHQLEAIIKKNDMVLGFPIEHRVKQLDSIRNKVERLSINLGRVDDLQDLVGIRIIFLFRRDVQRACEIIAKTFDVVKKENTEERLHADQFGYSSVHLITKLPETWLDVPAFTQLGQFKAEIQVRSVSQHIWASASHLLQYKKEQSVPVPIKRSIHRVSALLETVDLEFERLLIEREAYREQIDTADKNEPINVDIIEAVLDEIFPAINKDEEENYDAFLQDISHFKIKNALDLKNLLLKNKNATLAKEEEEVARLILENDYEFCDTHRLLSLGVFFTHVGLARGALENEFGKSWNEYMAINYSTISDDSDF